MGLLSFKGGVHPPEKKTLSEDVPLSRAPLPGKVFVFLRQSLQVYPQNQLFNPVMMFKTGQKIA